MWLLGTPVKREYAYSMTGLMHEMKSGRIDPSGRRLLHLRMTLSSFKREDLIFAQSMKDQKKN